MATCGRVSDRQRVRSNTCSARLGARRRFAIATVRTRRPRADAHAVSRGGKRRAVGAARVAAFRNAGIRQRRSGLLVVVCPPDLADDRLRVDPIIEPARWRTWPAGTIPFHPRRRKCGAHCGHIWVVRVLRDRLSLLDERARQLGRVPSREPDRRLVYAERSQSPEQRLKSTIVL